jgi:hypothetical protein
MNKLAISLSNMDESELHRYPAFGELIDTDKRLMSDKRIYRYPIGTALNQCNDFHPDYSLDEMFGKSTTIEISASSH